MGCMYMKKYLKIIFALAFFCVSVTPSAAMLFTDKSEPPEISSITEAPEKIEEYFSDNIGLRDEMITADAEIRFNVFKSSAVNNVIVGKDGWLYYRETLDDYKKSNIFTDRTIYRIAKTAELMNDYCNEFGITMVFTVAPNKNTIYPQYMPGKYISENTPSNLDRLNSLLDDKDFYVNLKNLFTQELDDGIIYYHKRDSHWNGLGAMEVYRTLQKNIASRNSKHLYNNYTDSACKTVLYSGDLAQMLFPAYLNHESDFQYDYNKNYTSATAGTNPMSNNIETHGGKQNYSICCYRDSFFNSLLDLFSTDANRARYTRQMPYDLISITENDYDVVIVEIAERNMENIVLYTPDCLSVNLCESPKTVKTSSAVQLCNVTETENTVRISGKIDDSFTQLDSDDNIYIEFKSDEKSVFYEAFPVCDESPYEDNGFSVKIEKNELNVGEYEIFIHVGDIKSSTVSCKAVVTK